jgi:hypothetical protein
LRSCSLRIDAALSRRLFRWAKKFRQMMFPPLAAFNFFSLVSQSRTVEFDSEQINEYVWQKMVMFSTANVASPNFGAKIYELLSPSTSSRSAAAVF